MRIFASILRRLRGITMAILAPAIPAVLPAQAIGIGPGFGVGTRGTRTSPGQYPHRDPP